MDEYGAPKPIRLIHRYCCQEEDDEHSYPTLTEYFLTGGTGIICIAALASAGAI
ncbi:MAG: hypothetical protein US13_C0016G0009 [candidate division TM6 bacterium GW2011_GWE2_36_25]|nr:MAG: hypothetical protein US03_C0010G0005 [candidate division TM6 bacterium GW2011_GWF2_36_131]KKQ02502.1 MAG: hypothetical protein US13_C0016G0009 [candidate division TM6 bacterium GW2011_GWE2_36_25]KKQ18805.1 MAG: hypothetical protein US32_C0022G0010 [candidate division TM6 bacterium GW2011_GWA2_36_9]